MIVVTTPTGSIGRHLVGLLLAADAPVRVVARDPARLPPDVRSRVEVVEGSHADADVVDRAFAGADAVFWLVPPNPRAERLEAAYLDFTRPACSAIRAHGVGHVVSVSALGRGTPVAGHAGLVTASLAMDDMLAETGTAFRSLAMPSFMDNLLRQVGAIRERGVFFGPTPGSRVFPTVATRDVAAVAAGLLLDPSWRGQETVSVLGPEDLSFDRMAETMSEVLGRPVRFQEVTLDAYRATLLGNGMSEAMAQGTIEMMDAKNRGLDASQSRATAAPTPTTFRRWCEGVLKPAVLGPAGGA